MGKKSFVIGEKVLYIPYNFFNTNIVDKCVFEMYYLGGSDEIQGRFFLTHDADLIKTFNKKEYKYPENGIIVCDDYTRIKKYSENLYKKYLLLTHFFLKNEDAYNNATRFFLAQDDFKKFFTYYGYNSKLFDNLVKLPYFIHIRFTFDLIWKRTLGTIKRLFFPVIFLIDLIKFIYEEHYNFKEAKRNLIKELHDNNSFIIRASTTEEQRKQGVDTKKKIVEAAKDVYSKSTINFFTLLISIISIIIGVVFFSISSNEKNEEIRFLQNENQRISTELYELIQANQDKNINEALLLQNEINANLQANLEIITRLLQDLKLSNNNFISE